MKATTRHCAVWVTVPDRITARKVARIVLEAKVAACANIVPGLESHYWWKGRLERGRELLLILKTSKAHLAELEALVRSVHPYETPEFVVTSLMAGSQAYLEWIDGSVRPVDRARARRRGSRASP